jgi:hypothetical protein
MLKLNKKEILILVWMFLLGAAATYVFTQQTPQEERRKHWKFQSIDTMKSSRDLAREELTDPNFAKEVDRQMADIAATGATHVAIGTPYDDEFLPVIKLWSRTARQHGLKVWFRGNWSGWEQWFGYPKIDQETHIENTRQFILNNSNLFEDGDIFTSCPECENGPKLELGNSFAIAEYRKFLIKEYQVTKEAFRQIDKDVTANYYSMNLDVAKAVMDKDTTKALDGVVAIDHYVNAPEQLAEDIQLIAQQSGGRIVLGELGAPIPDIHGPMNEDAQADWLAESLRLVSRLEEVEGINYWVNLGGSTALWRDNKSPKPAVEVLTQYYGGRQN